MSAEGLTSVIWRPVSGPPQPGWLEKTRLFVAQYSPSQGWTSVVLLILTFLVVSSSVASAKWVETPGLSWIMFSSALVGLVLAKVRLPSILLHPIGLAIGAVAVFGFSLGLVADQPDFGDKISALITRLDIWYVAAVSDGISTDLLPFALIILTLGWLLGYVGSWFLFRRDNVWVPVVLGGTAILTTLSFLPDKFGSRFFLFTFVAMLLIVWTNAMQKQEIWRKSNTNFSSTGSWLTIHSIIWFSIAVLLIASFLPMHVFVSKSLARTWASARSPIENLEDDFARLFSGIPSQKNVNGRFFGTSLPFLGAISFGGDVVFWAESDYPSYWLSQTYSEYTPQGWRAGDIKKLKIGPDAVALPTSDTLERDLVQQSLQLNFDTSAFLSSGNLDWVSHDAVVGALAPKEFEIDFLDESSDVALPPDIREVAKDLRDMFAEPLGDFIDADVSRNLPDDLVLTGIDTVEDSRDGTTNVSRMTLTRKEPIFPEVVSFKFDRPLEANHIVTLRSFVSLASDDDLRAASTDYDRFITDHYLQLPETLPERVREKAIELTADADTPFDKALAIQEYLRSDVFIYSQDIEAPPLGADGVDHFLFETKTGYSDYFGSSMTVLLREAGVPARMAAGYAPGQYSEEQNRWVVRDSDSHGWVQVYFPRYGWIDFEPTPAWDRHERRLITDLNATGSRDSSEGVLGAGDVDIFDPFDEEDLLEMFGNTGSGGFNTARNYARIGVRSAIVLGAGAIVWLILYTFWNAKLVSATPVERAYTKISRLGAFAGVPRRSHLTPIEYGLLLSKVVPEGSSDIDVITSAFASLRYSGAQDAHADEDRFERAWKAVRTKLLARGIKRLGPFGGAKS